jgi:hypothetical protein
VSFEPAAETPPLVDLWAERGYSVPHTLTAGQIAVLEANPQYRRYRKDGCVVCRGTGEHRWDGETLPCPDDGFGHAAERLSHWYWVHNIPLQYQLLDWREWPSHTAVKRAAKEDAEAWLEAVDGMEFYGIGLTVHSRRQGTGKTWLATAMQKELAKHGHDTWFVRFHEVVSLYAEENPARKRLLASKIKGASILVLDEVKQGASAAQQALYAEKLEELIRPRESDNLATILTTNLTREELEGAYGRVFSLLAAKNEWISLEGEDDARIGTDLWRQQAEAAVNGERPPIS